MPKVLIAEDDLMIADMIEEVLLDAGYEVCGIARTVAEAIALGRRHRPDFAIIDMRLADNGIGTDIVVELGMLGRIGVLYATGNMSKVFLTATNGDACLSKPYSPVDLLRALEIVADIVATGTAFPPFPHRFQVLRPITSSPQGDPHG